MDPENALIFNTLRDILPFAALIVTVSVAGWVANTWLRIKNGYPLNGAWGQAMHPKTDRESMERIRLLTTENAQLRAEIGSVKDRLETVERIITDKPSLLAAEIDRLSLGNGGSA